MPERLTADQLVQMIEDSPDNKAASGVSLMRSGPRLIIRSYIDIEMLTEKINAWRESTEEVGQ